MCCSAGVVLVSVGERKSCEDESSRREAVDSRVAVCGELRPMLRRAAGLMLCIVTVNWCRDAIEPGGEVER